MRLTGLAAAFVALALLAAGCSGDGTKDPGRQKPAEGSGSNAPKSKPSEGS